MSQSAITRAVVVMAKQPMPGSTKTRLVPPLTLVDAARIYECFLLDTLDLARSVPNASPMVAIWPHGSAGYFGELAPDIDQVQQVGDSLDERLDHVLRVCLSSGFDHVVAINSDSPTMPLARLESAFALLADDRTDMVLGPADDGGYYLMGWKRVISEVVRGVEMSTPRVLDDTLELARLAGVRVSLIDSWYDVDTAADLQRLERELRSAHMGGAHSQRFLISPMPVDR